MEYNEERYVTTVGVLLEKITSAYWIPKEIEDNIEEIIDDLDYKKLLEELKIDIEETEGIPDIHEEIIIAFEELKTYSEENFEKLKISIKEIINNIKNNGNPEW